MFAVAVVAVQRITLIVITNLIWYSIIGIFCMRLDAFRRVIILLRAAGGCRRLVGFISRLKRLRIREFAVGIYLFAFGGGGSYTFWRDNRWFGWSTSYKKE